MQGPYGPFLSICREPEPSGSEYSGSNVCICLCAGHCQDLHSSQRSFFSTSGSTMISAVLASAGNICTHSNFGRWESVPGRSNSDTLFVLKRYWKTFLDRRKSANKTSERVFGQERCSFLCYRLTFWQFWWAHLQRYPGWVCPVEVRRTTRSGSARK